MSFDPAEWSVVYDAPRPSGHELAFRHGADLALESCLARSRPGEHWVDVGAGPGHLAAALAAAGLRVTAVDGDEAMADAATARFKDLAYECAPAERLPFDDDSVDGVVATALIGLLPDPRPFLHEVSRVLRPGGTAVATLSNRSSPLHGIGMRMRSIGPDRHSRRYAARARRFSRRDAERELDSAGLRVVRTRYFNLFVAPGRRMLPPRRLALALEPRMQHGGGALLARNLLAVAENAR